MTDFLAALGSLTLGGSAAAGLLALASRSTRSRYAARWRCLAWALLCLRLAVPVPLLPETEQSPESLRCALLHELTHYRRRDIWLKTLALWVNLVHWFNPLMWYMVRLVERDTELACDEDALHLLAPEEHAAYGRAILDAADRLHHQAV